MADSPPSSPHPARYQSCRATPVSRQGKRVTMNKIDTPNKPAGEEGLVAKFWKPELD
jgi:hypothetical protein